MAITPTDALYAKQDPNGLAKKLGKGVTPIEAYYMKENPSAVAEKMGLPVDKVFYHKEGAADLAKAVEQTEVEQPDS